MQQLLKEIRSCDLCKESLPLGANPIVTGSPQSKIVIIGQAPGKIVHESSIPWNDKSGDNLRKWMDVDRAIFYDPNKIALVPMGFCYPGRGKSGDLPPRPECAPLWHRRLMEMMEEVRLTMLVGSYAQAYYLENRSRKTLTETVKNFHEYLPEYLPLPHPSPRNNIWQAKNPWFGEEVLPILKERVKRILEE
ncbi:uracil-DNA glycosylase family protein [Echinicola strongylocentroti]|uniref:Uracil-DNA glycosylase family protein n=1 Tax=Echinicola strongylocentroti TaxID=1795355 RepID=A0A2Z4IQN9_9BACT|nr:uracil-DNA glycosylase family protein [Echinicola strongylocentroti]AWW33134.1 uracil-DNA glycosylase family protein [Echinicola strongylocentroti]